MATDKQNRWQSRNRILWRLKGMTIPYYAGTGILTQVEVDKLSTAFSLIREVCNNSVQSSIELGFNAKPRCRCGKPALEGEDNCRKCYEEQNRRYRS